MNAKQIREYMIKTLTENSSAVWEEGMFDIPTEQDLEGAVKFYGEFEPMPEELYDCLKFDMPEDALSELVRSPGPKLIIGNGCLFCYTGDEFLASYMKFVPCEPS